MNEAKEGSGGTDRSKARTRSHAGICISKAKVQRRESAELFPVFQYTTKTRERALVCLKGKVNPYSIRIFYYRKTNAQAVSPAASSLLADRRSTSDF